MVGEEDLNLRPPGRETKASRDERQTFNGFSGVKKLGATANSLPLQALHDPWWSCGFRVADDSIAEALKESPTPDLLLA